MAEPQVCRFGAQTRLGSRNPVLDGAPDHPRETAILRPTEQHIEFCGELGYNEPGKRVKRARIVPV